MGRAKQVSDEAILDAARAVFLDGGYGASTPEIAARAGVSEALLFKRFKTKDELFARAMGVAEEPEWIRSIDGLAGTGTARENLTALALSIIDFFRTLVPRLMMSWSARLEPTKQSGRKERAALRNLRALTRYLEEEMALGRIRKTNAEVVARVLLGALINYAFFEAMEVYVHAPMSPKTYAQSLIDTLWQGLAPNAPARKKTSKPRKGSSS